MTRAGTKLPTFMLPYVRHLRYVWVVGVRRLSLVQTAADSTLSCRGLRRGQTRCCTLSALSHSPVYVRWSLLGLNKQWRLSPIKLGAAVLRFVSGGNQSGCASETDEGWGKRGRWRDFLKTTCSGRRRLWGTILWMSSIGPAWTLAGTYGTSVESGRPRTVSPTLGWKSLRWSAEVQAWHRGMEKWSKGHRKTKRRKGLLFLAAVPVISHIWKH